MELISHATERANYVLTNLARVVAMTCTHAALKVKKKKKKKKNFFFFPSAC